MEAEEHRTKWIEAEYETMGWKDTVMIYEEMNNICINSSMTICDAVRKPKLKSVLRQGMIRLWLNWQT